jgi:hypothetical protein
LAYRQQLFNEGSGVTDESLSDFLLDQDMGGQLLVHLQCQAVRLA